MSKSDNKAVCRDVQPGDATRYTYARTTVEVPGHDHPLSRITVNVGGFGYFGRFESITVSGNSNSDRINYINCDPDSYAGKMLALIAASYGVVGEMGSEWIACARDRGAEGFCWLGDIGSRVRVGGEAK